MLQGKGIQSNLVYEGLLSLVRRNMENGRNQKVSPKIRTGWIPSNLMLKQGDETMG